MSRSTRKNPVCAFAGSRDSEKAEKKKAHRAERVLVRRLLYVSHDFEALVLPLKQEMSDINAWSKDGKCRFGPPAPDADEDELCRYARLMRK